MKVLFLSSANIDEINQRNIYSDLIRHFIKNNHILYVVSPAERRLNKKTTLTEGENYKILQIKTLNLQKNQCFRKRYFNCINWLFIQKGDKKIFW